MGTLLGSNNICPTCKYHCERNKCDHPTGNYIRWKDGYTLKIKPVPVACPGWIAQEEVEIKRA